MPPAAAAQSPPRASSPASLAAILEHERNLLHLHLYKARNQHRTSLWFKHLRILKRAVERLLLHLQTAFPDDPTDESTDDSDDDDGDEHLRDQLAADATFAALLSRLQDTVIPASYAAFTHLTTSTQYAGLGMVLLGCLARIHSALEPFTRTDDRHAVALHRTEEIPLQQPVDEPTSQGDEEAQEDLGELISRDSAALLYQLHIPKTNPPKRQTVEIRTARAASRSPDTNIDTTAVDDTNTTKKRTAIDDLFAGL
ncbi:hypothetical protein Dda_0918 [Drechslerella dactyloides]|uniref:RNase MRP protein 1 RNA binding domain-containing protein n=1 Tax=Drechslerella dactyloides TaxID=74499 RepID=A0AAD6J8D0_DREDA|nr:hypothetical protein Dda_0918 [Drechslerella dactyloides]